MKAAGSDMAVLVKMNMRPSPFDRRLSTIEINDYFCFFKYR